MFAHLTKKTKNIIVSMRFSILAIFVSLFVISMVSLIVFTYSRFVSVMTYVSIELMKKTSANVFTEVTNELHNVEIASHFGAELIAHKVVDPKNQWELIAYTKDLMRLESKSFTSVESAYWGDENGNYIMAATEPDGSISSNFITRTEASASRQFIHRDLTGTVIATGSLPDVSYDPRGRPWYTIAKTTKTTGITDIMPLKFSEAGNLGLSINTPVYDPEGALIGIFGLNLRLDFIRKFIEKIPLTSHGKVFIVTEGGKLIAFPNIVQVHNKELMDIHSLADPSIVASFEQYQKNHASEFIFNFKGERYLATYEAIPAFGPNHWLIGNVIPESIFVNKIQQMSFVIICFSLVILLLGLLGISTLVTRLVKPLKKLVEETEKIKNFEIEESAPIRSRIKEILLLSNAIQSMKQGLRSFKKYVPALLVRQLIETGEDARIGGTKKQLAILFSDIKNFTTLSEHEEPNELMEQICEYLDAVTHIIIEENGTIDKYIGDSVMAFWGAPLPDENPCCDAASAALKCIKRINQLNLKWQAEGKPAYFTRIGIHLGEAIVGNMGSSERLSYTAIGDSINTASRLEGVNKIYDTKIIVSDIVYHTIKNQFVLRKIDRVQLKGKADTHYIYELLAQHPSELSFDIDAYLAAFEEGFAAYQNQAWDTAAHAFTRCLAIFPEDTVAPIFIQRITNLKQNPPMHWNGVWQMQDK